MQSSRLNGAQLVPLELLLRIVAVATPCVIVESVHPSCVSGLFRPFDCGQLDNLEQRLIQDHLIWLQLVSLV